MTTHLKHLFSAAALSLVFAVGFLAPSVGAADNVACTSNFLTFPAWYSNVTPDCDSGTLNLTKLNDFWLIPLNFVDILLQVVAYAAVGYLVWGGFKYIKSRGDPGAIQQAQEAILNAVIGLGVSLASVGIVKFVSGNITGNGVNAYGLPKVPATAAELTSAMNSIVFPIAGAIAVIFLIIGAYKYVMSNGDSGETKKARYTIIYSIVGLVIITMAFAIVQLILGRFSS